jgi:Uma2 family endonuclease
VAIPNPNHTIPEDFLTTERSNPHKHEYVGGRIYAMAGANDRHNAIVSSSNIALGGQLRKRPCVTYTRDMKVQTLAAGYLHRTPIPSSCCTALTDCTLVVGEVYEKVGFGE